MEWHTAAFLMSRGLYIGKYYPSLGGGGYQPMSFGVKNMKRRGGEGRNANEKGSKGK
jgi:hypothetical protein